MAFSIHKEQSFTACITGFPIMNKVLVLILALNFLASGGLYAQAPRLINFQAQLNGQTGSAAAVTFSIYDAPTSGNLLWSESYPNLAVQSGRIHALLGSNTPIPASVFEEEGDRYIAIGINGETLAPRSPITSVGYALRATVADRLLNGSGTGSVTSLNALTGDIVLAGGENVSVTPDGQTLRIDATGGSGMSGITTITAGTGITVSDVDGPTTVIGIAANAITDTQIADNSIGASSLGSDSVGESEIQTNAVGSSELKTQVKFGPSGKIEIGDSSNDTSILLESITGHGRLTVNNTLGSTGVRIWGDLTTSPFIGGSMATYKRDGVNSSMWVRTEGTSSANSWGVLSLYDAQGDPTVEMDGSNGNLTITGNMSKGSGSFKIDHPLDPENKYLSHSFVESPDMMNVYNGNIILDENGEAWIELPEWFEVLNRDFRYQLTCIGGQALVYIDQEIKNNRFKIAGGNPGLKVSWQVTGIRHDPYAEFNRIKVEEDKSASKRGRYLHPEAYGVPRQ